MQRTQHILRTLSVKSSLQNCVCCMHLLYYTHTRVRAHTQETLKETHQVTHRGPGSVGVIELFKVKVMNFVKELWIQILPPPLTG